MSHAAAELARKAAEVLRERGQHKGSLLSADGRVCALGALCIAKGCPALSTSELLLGAESASPESEVYTALRDRYGMLTAYVNVFGSLRSIAAWNDDPTTTQADVEKAFLQIADELEFADERPLGVA